MKISAKKITWLETNIRKFGWYIPLSNLFILYGSKFLPNSIVQRIATRKHQKIEDYLVNRLYPTIEVQTKKEFPMVFVEKAPIWYCWLQGEEKLPTIPALCYDSLKRQANGHPVRFITLENYKDYVTIPDSIVQLYKEGKIKNAHFADILRLSLLYNHGGLWADATIFFSNTIPEEIFDLPFYSIKTPEEGFYVSCCRWSGFFLAGWKNNPLFGAMLEMYDSYLKEDFHFVDYLMMDYFIDILYQKIKPTKNMIDKVPYNNSSTYALRNLLIKDFNKNIWESLTKDTHVFKLDWRMYSDNDLSANKNNYFAKLSDSVK